MKLRTQRSQKQQILNIIPIFLAKTYRIIDNPNYSQIIQWTEDGKSFVIKNISKLTTDIFPKHFKHNNYGSFVRQLNMYGFSKKRFQEEKDEGQVYEHDFFERDHPEKLVYVKRKKNFSNQEKKQSQHQIALIPSEREKKLQSQVQLLKTQHRELQSMMQMLMEQNKVITNQNKAFTRMMAEMKEKYRKKLQTLMILFLFGKKVKPQDSQFLNSNNFQHMLQSFEQFRNQSPLALELNPPTSMPKRKSSQQMKMIQAQHDEQKSDIFDILNKDSKSVNGSERLPSIPPSPLESINCLPSYNPNSNSNSNQKNDWQYCLQRLNRSDYESETEKKERQS